jgi:hypothetical protein
MTIAQAIKAVEENTMYLALLDDEDCEAVKAALFAQTLEAKKVLAKAGVVVA